MPELPEVETVRRGLERTIVGKTVAAVDVRVPKLFAADRSLIESVLVGQRVVAINRRAKVLLVQLANGWTLAIHLKMTGQIIVIANRKPQIANRGGQQGKMREAVRRSPFAISSSFVGGHPERAYEQPLPHRHTHVIISLTDGSVLYFNDLRKFGWLRLLRSSRNHESRIMNHESQTIEEFLDGLAHGPEPLEAAFTLEYFQKFLKTRTTLIKTLLLDQSFIAGIGNIYADEALFAAAIKPTRWAQSLTKAEGERLFHAITQVLQLGIESGGTSFNSYRNVEGTPGKMREHLKVYGREGKPCPRCGELIVRKKIGQRSAHYCPSCQR